MPIQYQTDSYVAGKVCGRLRMLPWIRFAIVMWENCLRMFRTPVTLSSKICSIRLPISWRRRDGSRAMVFIGRGIMFGIGVMMEAARVEA